MSTPGSDFTNAARRLEAPRPQSPLIQESPRRPATCSPGGGPTAWTEAESLFSKTWRSAESLFSTTKLAWARKQGRPALHFEPDARRHRALVGVRCVAHPEPEGKNEAQTVLRELHGSCCRLR